MFNKIQNEINNFTTNIKEEKECDDLVAYMVSDYFSSIKLLMSISKTFSTIGRVLLFLVITFTGLLMASTINVVLVSSTLLGAITLFLFVLILLYISHCKKLLLFNISEAKKRTSHK